MVSVKETSKILGVSVATVYNWRNKNIISPSYISPTGRIFFAEDTVNDLILKGTSNSIKQGGIVNEQSIR